MDADGPWFFVTSRLTLSSQTVMREGLGGDLKTRESKGVAQSVDVAHCLVSWGAARRLIGRPGAEATLRRLCPATALPLGASRQRCSYRRRHAPPPYSVTRHCALWWDFGGRRDTNPIIY